MFSQLVIFWIVQIFILILGICLGQSIFIYKIRKEENKRRSLELSLMEKRAEVLKEGKQIAHDLEEVLYKAKVQQEINDILKKKGSF